MTKLPSLFDCLANWVIQIDKMPRPLVRMVHATIFVCSGAAAYLLRFDFAIPHNGFQYLIRSLAVWLVVKLVVFRLCGLEQGWWRFVSIQDLRQIALGNTIGSFISAIAILAIVPHGLPRSLYIIDFIVCSIATSGVRVLTRVFQESSSKCRDAEGQKRVLIYGAGRAGLTLLHEIRNNRTLPYRVVGFIDDSTDKKGLHLGGIPVLGNGEDIALLVKERNIDLILIAIPSASGMEMTRILILCHGANVECKTVPGLAEIISSAGLVNQVREVAVEDLLGRRPVHLAEDQIRSSLFGKVVMVTGAAGSIGAELCRQIARFQPAGIVGFDSAESPLFEIDREMLKNCSKVPFHAEIGSVQRCDRLDEVFNRYNPTVVYHAAAYKHVPMMEAHAFEAVENNVFGTYNVAMAAAAHKVQDFVLISTDKAVRPTSVMGATKRAAELLLMALQNKQTKYVAVRFGNVLGSNGSVVPIFRRQIAAGGPVTVTHPEMRRFFMTIPEACQLVLQASVIGRSGQICVLDMGDPVKIIELAKKLIVLSGLRPDRDVKIEFTGVRPGEKLSEELNSMLEETVPTTHESIRIFMGSNTSEINVSTWLSRLVEICAIRDVGQLALALKELVLDYSPSAQILKKAIASRPITQPPATLSISQAIDSWDHRVGYDARTSSAAGLPCTDSDIAVLQR